MKSLTKGNPLKLITLFAIPLAIGQLFQQFYSLVDIRIVGSALGEIPLAAVGASTVFSDFVIGFINYFCNGFAIVIATCFGSGNGKNLKKAVAASFITGAVLSLILTVSFMIFMDPLLRILNVDASLMDMSKSYLRIIILGLFFTILYNTCAAVLRGIGDTVTPLIFLILSSILNILLDYIFIICLHMGVAGASAATVLSQAISAVLCVIRIIKKYPALHLSREDFSYDGAIYSNILTTGFSMALMISLVHMGTLILQSAINSFGAYVIVAHTAARKMSHLMMMPCSFYGTALAAFSGQNYGAGEHERIRKGCISSIIAVSIWNTAWLILVWIAGRNIISLISASSNEEVLYWGSMYLKVDICFYLLCALICLIRNTLQGMGHSMITIISSFLELLVKSVIAFTLAPVMGYWGIIWCEPIAWVIMLIPLLIEWFLVFGIHSLKENGSQQ